MGARMGFIDNFSGHDTSRQQQSPTTSFTQEEKICVAKSAQKIADEINKSLKVVRKTSSRKTKLSHIDKLSHNISAIKTMRTRYPFLTLFDLDKIETEIEQIHEEHLKLGIKHPSTKKNVAEFTRHEKETKSNISGLTKQCATYDLPIDIIPGIRLPGSKRLWMNKNGIGVQPEIIALLSYESAGYQAFWCQGSTLLFLMKAACFSVMSEYKSWSSLEGNETVWHSSKIQTQDNQERYRTTVGCILFEALCLCFADHHDEIVNAIKVATTEEIEKFSIEFIDTNCLFRYVKIKNVLALWHAIGSDLLAKIARIFVTGNYDYRSGWPDLILVRDNKFRFVEVKTTDLFHANQIRIINTFAKPLNLPFSVAHVVPIE